MKLSQDLPITHLFDHVIILCVCVGGGLRTTIHSILYYVGTREGPINSRIEAGSPQGNFFEKTKNSVFRYSRWECVYFGSLIIFVWPEVVTKTNSHTYIPANKRKHTLPASPGI